MSAGSRGLIRIVAGLCVAAAVLPVAADETAAALEALLSTERELLREDTRRYEEWTARRARTATEMSEVRRSLDAAVQRSDAEAPASIRRLADDLDRLEAQRSSQRDGQRRVVERIAERGRRIRSLEARLAGLEGERQASGALTGAWDVTLMPSGQRGSFLLRQSGTIVSGTYTLAGGWSGSLQGTLVERKVYLVRIDSKLGRSMEFEGYLSADESRIRGNWLSYELSADGSRGQWSATRAEAP